MLLGVSGLLVNATLSFGFVIGVIFLLEHFWLSKRDRELVDPVLPSEFDDWDAEFLRLTGKTVWEARYEADPELRKSLVTPGSAQNDINPFYLAAQQQQTISETNLREGPCFQDLLEYSTS